jgi:C4-dicarboxylate-binding protein DctP
MKKFVLAAATAATFALSGTAFAADDCSDGEIVIKFSHVVSANRTSQG